MADKMFGHEEALKDKEIESRRISSTMSAEQLLAEQAKHLDAEAQRKMAESLGDVKSKEIESRIYEQQLEDARARERQAKIEAEAREQLLREDQQRVFSQMSSDRNSIMGYMAQMMGMVAGVKNESQAIASENRELRQKEDFTQQRIIDREAENQRLKQNLEHEQKRNDDTYERVLQHEEKLQDTTVEAIKATHTSSMPSQRPYINTMECPNCHKTVIVGKFCELCGSELNIGE